MQTLLTNGNIYVERGVFAEAVLVEDKRIKYVGDTETAKLQGGAIDRVIDLGGRTVVPGFNDDHCHPLMAAYYSSMLNLNGCVSMEDLVQRSIAFYNQPHQVGRPLLGRGWNANLFTEGEKRMPNRYDLDRITTDVPVVFVDATEHFTVGNSRALEMAGIGNGYVPAPGGVVYLDENGDPTGQVGEMSRNLLIDVIPEMDAAEIRDAFLRFMNYANSVGVTSWQGNDAGEFRDPAFVFDMYHDLSDAGLLTVRYHAQNAFTSTEAIDEYLAGELQRPGYNDYFTPGPVKLFCDGTIGTRTALMSVDFLDDPGNRGERLMSYEQILELATYANSKGLQVITHAIGDQAVRDMTEIYAQSSPAPGNPLRNVINHCQLMTPDMIDRMAEVGVLAACQPIFLHSDMHSLETRITEEMARTSNCYRTQIERMRNVAFGTDCPVEDINPFKVVYSAVTRKDLNGFPEGGYFPEECIDVASAIDCYSINSAYQQFMEETKGRIAEGYLADLVVLPEDIFTMDPMAIKDLTADLTMVGGEIVFER